MQSSYHLSMQEQLLLHFLKQGLNPFDAPVAQPRPLLERMSRHGVIEKVSYYAGAESVRKTIFRTCS